MHPDRFAHTRRRRRFSPLAVAIALALGLALPGLAAAAPISPSTAFPSPEWVDTIGPVALSSPVTGTIRHIPVIAFGTESGYLYVVNARTGRNLPGWPRPVDIAPGVPTAVESSPTIAYLDGRNKPPTIIVGAGSTYVSDQQGGLVAFNANGTVRFRFITQKIFNEWTPKGPNNYTDGVFSTPAIGDVTGDGQQDIVFGSWDHNLYALTPEGKLVPGFPVDNLDTIWSSPALFHIRGSSRLDDIFIGGDASGRGGCFGGFVTDYSYVNGKEQAVWQHCENQTIWSSPAIGVINSSGRPAVVVGTGFGEPPPYKSDSFRLFAFYADDGSPVPGWPVLTAGPAFGSPAIGMLPGSATPAVVDTTWCMRCSQPGGASMVYAWDGNGRQLWSQTLPGANDFSSPVLVDLTGSGMNDVVVGSSAGLYALDGGSGGFLFGTSATNPINTASMLNSVAVERIPGGGPRSGWHLFEACGGPKQVASTGLLYDYPLPGTPAIEPAWAGWRAGPSHSGVATSTLSLLRPEAAAGS